MGTGRQYDEKFKLEAVKLAREVGTKKAAEDLDIPKNTLPDFATCSTNISTKKIKNLRKIWDFLLTNSL